MVRTVSIDKWLNKCKCKLMWKRKSENNNEIEMSGEKGRHEEEGEGGYDSVPQDGPQ